MKLKESFLFLGMIIIFLPIYISSAFQFEGSFYTFGIMTVFAVQTLILLYIFRTGIFDFKENKKLYILLLLFVASQIWVLLTADGDNMLRELTNIIAIALNGTIIIGARHYGITEKQTYSFMTWFTQFSIAACLYNIVVNYSIIVNVIVGLNEEYVQIASFLPNRNTFGFLMVCAVYAVFLLMDIEYRKWHLFALILFLFNLILTMSRTSIIAVALLFIVELVYLIVSKEYTFKKICKIVLMSIGGLKKHLVFVLSSAILFLVSFCSIRYNGNVINSLKSQIVRTNSSGRTELWQEGISVWQERPLFGVGRFESISFLEEAGSHLTQFHNAYIEALASHGIFGLCLYFFLFLWIFIKVIKCGLKTNIKVTIVAFYICIAFQALLETRIRFSCGLVDTFTMFFIVLIPLLLIRSHPVENSKQSEK